MSDIQLFRIHGSRATEIRGTASELEKQLQTLIETNLETLLAIRFLTTEHRTGKVHGGRIDTLGIDENNCPVIIEYKRSSSENVINQGLFYLDWLMDHQAEFKLLVLERFGKTVSDAIDWSSPRLLCIAADFTRYDSHAVQQINRNIDLIRYRRFGQDLLLLELVNATTAAPLPVASTGTRTTAVKTYTDKTVEEWLADMPADIAPTFDELVRWVLELGDDVQRKDLKLYIAFTRLRNFATVVFQRSRLRVYLHLDPREVSREDLESGFGKDVTNKGHWGTGNTELNIVTLKDLERAKPYIKQAYEGGSPGEAENIDESITALS